MNACWNWAENPGVWLGALSANTKKQELILNWLPYCSLPSYETSQNVSCWCWSISIHFWINFNNVCLSQYAVVLGANEVYFRPMGSREERSFTISPTAHFSLLRTWSKGQHLCSICCWLCSLISAHHYWTAPMKVNIGLEKYSALQRNSVTRC